MDTTSDCGYGNCRFKSYHNQFFFIIQSTKYKFSNELFLNVLQIKLFLSKKLKCHLWTSFLSWLKNHNYRHCFFDRSDDKCGRPLRKKRNYWHSLIIFGFLFGVDSFSFAPQGRLQGVDDDDEETVLYGGQWSS